MTSTAFEWAHASWDNARTELSGGGWGEQQTGSGDSDRTLGARGPRGGQNTPSDGGSATTLMWYSSNLELRSPLHLVYAFNRDPERFLSCARQVAHVHQVSLRRRKLAGARIEVCFLRRIALRSWCWSPLSSLSMVVCHLSLGLSPCHYILRH